MTKISSMSNPGEELQLKIVSEVGGVAPSL